MAKRKAKIVDVTGFNASHIEDALSSALSNDWEVIQFIVISSKTFAILQKTISE